MSKTNRPFLSGRVAFVEPCLDRLSEGLREAFPCWVLAVGDREIERRRHNNRHRDHEQIVFVRRLVEIVLVATPKLHAALGRLLTAGIGHALEEAFEQAGKMILERSLRTVSGSLPCSLEQLRDVYRPAILDPRPRISAKRTG